MAEDEAELGEVTTIVGRLVEHLLLALLEQLDRLLALTHEVVDEDAKVLVAVQDLHPVLVLAVDEPQPLIRVRQDVEDERRRVLEVHALVLAELHHLVHQLPGLVQGTLVGRQLRRRHRVREAAVQLLEDRADGVDGASAAAVSGRRHLDGRTDERTYARTYRTCVRACVRNVSSSFSLCQRARTHTRTLTHTCTGSSLLPLFPPLLFFFLLHTLVVIG